MPWENLGLHIWEPRIPWKNSRSIYGIPRCSIYGNPGCLVRTRGSIYKHRMLHIWESWMLHLWKPRMASTHVRELRMPMNPSGQLIPKIISKFNHCHLCNLYLFADWLEFNLWPSIPILYGQSTRDYVLATQIIITPKLFSELVKLIHC